MVAKQATRSALQSIGLLEPARIVLRKLRAAQRRRYYELVIRQYRSPFAKPTESYAAYERREREASEATARGRFEADRKAILDFARTQFSNDSLELSTLERSLLARYGSAHCAQRIVAALAPLTGSGTPQAGPGGPVQGNAKARFDSDRAALVRAILDQVINASFAPRFYDYDYVDDIVGIVGGRYCSDSGCSPVASTAILDALCILAGSDGRAGLPALSTELRRLLGNDHGYVPLRGDVTKHVRNVIPEMADEFIALKAERNVERFLEINREYSWRQAHGLGVWDVRDLSLLRGYERDHHLLLRTILSLIDGGHLSRQDEVLLIGPRHIDEVVFFRKSLGLRKTIGLDLFPFGKDEIIAGDMHRMPFEPNRFKLIFCAGTISYSYNVRRVIDEIARVAKRPSYVFLLDAGGRMSGTNALGRSDIPTVDALIGLFHRLRFQVLAKDTGKSLAPDLYDNEPCCAVRLDEGPDPLPGGSETARYLQASG